MPKGTIPSNIALPSHFSIKGYAKGTTKVINTDLNLYSTLGNAAVVAKMDMRRKNRELFDIKANLQNLNVGKLIQNKDLGRISAVINAKGQGFDPKIMSAQIAGSVRSAT